MVYNFDIRLKISHVSDRCTTEYQPPAAGVNSSSFAVTLFIVIYIINFNCYCRE